MNRLARRLLKNSIYLSGSVPIFSTTVSKLIAFYIATEKKITLHFVSLD